MANRFKYIFLGILCLVDICFAATTEDDSFSTEFSNQLDCKRLEKLIVEKVSKQRGIDDDWLRNYRELFLESSSSKRPEQLANDIDNLFRKYNTTSDSAELKPLRKNVRQLQNLKHLFVSNCDKESFQLYDNLIEKYSAKDFSESISKFVKQHRSRFWNSCLGAFLDGQNQKEATYENDESEVNLIVDHILEKNPEGIKEEPWVINDIGPIEEGLVSYTQAKLGRKAHKFMKIDDLFQGTIRAACFSVKDRFVGRNMIASIIKNRPDLKKELGQKDRKWLMAIRICEFVEDYPGDLERNVVKVLTEKKQESRMNSCMGKLFHKSE